MIEENISWNFGLRKIDKTEIQKKLINISANWFARSTEKLVRL